MGYADREDGYKGVKYGIGAMAVLGIGFALKMCSAVGGLPPMTQEQAESQLLADPDGGPLFATVKRTFPSEFAALTADMAERGRSFATTADMGKALFRKLGEAEVRHHAEIAQAPHTGLAGLWDAQVKLAEALQGVDPQLCADFIAHGAYKTDREEPSLASPALAYHQATWEAAAAGRDTPAHRTVAAPKPAMIRAITDAMVAGGLDRHDVEEFINGRRTSGPLACKLGLAYVNAVKALPPDQEDAFVAFLAQPA